MSRYIEGETRSQSMLFPERLEESLTRGSKSMAPVLLNSNDAIMGQVGLILVSALSETDPALY